MHDFGLENDGLRPAQGQASGTMAEGEKGVQGEAGVKGFFEQGFGRVSVSSFSARFFHRRVRPVDLVLHLLTSSSLFNPRTVTRRQRSQT